MADALEDIREFIAYRVREGFEASTHHGEARPAIRSWSTAWCGVAAGNRERCGP